MKNPITEKNYSGKYLLIDGNYFGHRLIHGLRISNPDFNLESSVEQQSFGNLLNDGLLNLYKSFNNQHHRLIDNIVFVFDHSSWRKKVEEFRPYYISINSPEKLGYKDNRKDLKELSSINWDNFDKCMNQFKDRINKNIPVINFEGAEGDDSLFLLTKQLEEKNILSLIFCSDGDLTSLVSDNCIVIKNVKSKLSPNGEIIISQNIYDFVYKPKDIMTTMLGNDNSQFSDYLETLFKIDVSNGGTVRSNLLRIKNDNIYVPQKYLNLISKVICGDAKDNIFPIIRWEKNNKNFKATEKMFEKAVTSVDFMDYDDNTVKHLFNDDKIMSIVIKQLMNKCGVDNKHFDSIFKHYKRNKMLNHLSFESIPQKVQTDFKENVLNVESLLYRSVEDSEIFSIGLNTAQHDKAKDLMINSIPSDLTNSILNS